MDRPVTDNLIVLCASFIALVATIEDIVINTIDEINKEITGILEFF